jgi:ABC-type transporter MlaC component
MPAFGNFIRTRLAALACLVAIAGGMPAEALGCPAAETVKGAATAFIRAAKTGSIQAFSAALGRYTNVDELALFALGKFRGRLPPERRSEYVANARRYMSEFLADNSARFRGANLTIASCEGNIVKTSVNGGSDMTWRVAGGRIKDVQVSGIWLTLQLRQNFSSIIKRERGVTGLLDYLARKSLAEARPKQN